MEQVLVKLARQLNALDEASLMTLWDKYQDIVANYQPGKQWEDSVLVMSMIQAVRWKNQLINFHLKSHDKGELEDKPIPVIPTDPSSSKAKNTAKVLPFQTKKKDE